MFCMTNTGSAGVGQTQMDFSVVLRNYVTKMFSWVMEFFFSLLNGFNN